jgi:NodT family efflux transporter outer membrane factor (OMF) lipoprotein
MYLLLKRQNIRVMVFRRLLPAALVAVLLVPAGCSVGPSYSRPKILAPEAYKEGKGWKIARPEDNVIRGAWWEVFNDPQLNELEVQVNVSNQDLARAEAQFRQARALVQAARSQYFPTLSAGASYTRAHSSANTGKNTAGALGSSGETFTDLSLPFDVTWEIDFWGKIRRSVEASRASAQASAADLETTRLSLQAELAQDYFQLCTADALKQLLDSTVSDYRYYLQLTKNRYASDVASRGDVLQAETQLKTTEAQAMDVGVQRAQFEHAIAVLIGKAPADFSIPITPLKSVPPPVPAGVPSELLERRPDIAAAERRMAAANAQIGVAVAAFYPNITLSASGGFEASSLAKWLAWPSRFWSVGPAVLETVFEGGLRRALTTQARAAYDGEVAAYRQSVLNAFQEVEDNLAALRILQDEDRVQNDAVTASQQSVTISRNQYKAGIISYLDVVVTQAIALGNKRIAINILGRRMNAAVLLIKALGGGWQSSELPSGDSLDKKPEKQP